MILDATPMLARHGRRLRTLVLTLFALFVAHDAIYVAQFGVGARYAAAMAATGHDAYYVPASLIVGTTAALIAAVAILRLARLTADRAGGSRALAPMAVEAGPGYLHELRFTWLRLFPTVVALFVLQENLEAWFGPEHDLPGLANVLGNDSGVVLPILAITTFLLASLGAAIRWRTRTLEARSLAAVRARIRIAGRAVPPAWIRETAALPHEWTLDRR
ncbi:MAG TPA: hypothetical protein VH440_03815, partial [Candidatus Limnocylindrales bacterium]